MYQLVKNIGYESHKLTLTFHAQGLALYAFTFTTCIAPAGADDEQLIRIR